MNKRCVKYYLENLFKKSKTSYHETLNFYPFRLCYRFRIFDVHEFNVEILIALHRCVETISEKVSDTLKTFFLFFTD